MYVETLKEGQGSQKRVPNIGSCWYLSDLWRSRGLRRERVSHFIGRHIGGEIMALSSIVRRVESPVSRVIVWAQ